MRIRSSPKVSAISAQQTQTGSRQGGDIGLAITSGGLMPVWGGGGGRTVHRTLLAERLRPPAAKGPGRVPGWAWGVVVLGFCFYIIPGVLLLVWWIPGLRRGVVSANIGAAEALAVWNRSYDCRRCDTVFDPGESPASP
jgi:hypothetical protein